MGLGSNIKKRRNPSPVRATATMLYLGEVIVALSLSIALVATSRLGFAIIVLCFFGGAVAWTFAEYIAHRFVLHSIATAEHRHHHAHPREPIDRIVWQTWAAFGV